MADPREYPMRFVPRGVSDTTDGDNSAPGACSSLQNLMFTLDTPGVLLCRPANIALSYFPGFGTAGVVSAAYRLGNLIYGLIGSNIHPGNDQPFVFNIVTGLFVAVTNVSSANTPATQPSVGAWTPPTMDMVGTKIIVTHPGFNFAAGYAFGWFETTSGSPVWNAGNTTGAVQLAGIPQAVAQYNNRAWFAQSNNLIFTDTLSLNISNAGIVQVLTIGDATPINALCGLPAYTTSGGIIQALLAFKPVYIAQVTGDSATANLAQNALSESVGTNSPRSVVQTPDGIFFMAVDGIRKVTLQGAVTEPDDDLALPFVFAAQPSRVAAAFNSDTYRICTQNTKKLGSPYEGYYYNLRRKAWVGPQTFRDDLILPYGNDFVVFNNALPGTMWQSFATQGHLNQGNTFLENAVPLQWKYITAPMTDTGNMYANSVIRSTLDIAFPSTGDAYVFQGSNQDMAVLANAVLTAPTLVAVWGSFYWGAATWGAKQLGLSPRIIPWTQPLIFNKLIAQASGASSLGLRLGAWYFGYEKLNYMMQ